MAQVVEQLSSKHKNSNPITSWALVAYACNPNYSRGRDQEDRGSKPAQPYLEKTHHKMCW
jgi:hypothetical protein